MNKCLFKIGINIPKTDIRFCYLNDNLKELNIELLEIDNSIPNDQIKSIINEDKEVEVLYFNILSNNNLANILEVFPNIKWVQGNLAGVDRFVPFGGIFKEKNITFTNVKGAFSPSLGEFTLAAIMYWEKNLDIFKNTQKLKNWCKAPVSMLSGKTLTIVGYGNIGIEVAKRAKMFGIKVIAIKNRINITDGNEYTDEFLDNSSIDYALSNSDYVVSILPKTDKTDDYFDDKKFSTMKKGSIFINIGRGNSVNENDLVKHLKSQSNLKAACLDVTKIEPLPQDSELWNCENCLISNHSADFLNDGFNNEKNSLDIFIEIMKKEYLVDKKIKTNIIDLDNGY